MRPWIPPRLSQPAQHGLDGVADDGGAARSAGSYLARPVTLVAAQLDGKDIGFCAELAFHGGSRVSHDGFTNEGDLLRLHEAGLLDLQRQEERPFMIVKISLSAAARRLVGCADAPRADGWQAEGAQADGGQAGGDTRRQGFEVARAMIGVAAKSEIAAWRLSGGSGGAAALERRVMNRILSIDSPFQ
jgi:hypothetical protein